MKPVKLIILMCLASFITSACSALCPPKAPLHKLSFNFDGTIGGNSFEWNIERLDDGTGRFVYIDLLSRNREGLSDTVPAHIMDELEELCRKYKVHRWDGYRGYNRHICDGSGFSLYIRYRDGRTVNAHGMNKFPRHYREFRDELYLLFEPIQDKLTE